MDYEKKYFDAIERLKQWDKEHQNGYVVSDRDKFIFPELKESEDERIRKMLIEKMKRCHEYALENNVVQDIKDSSDAIAWLEAQGKQFKECMYSKDNYTDEDRKVLCNGCEEDCVILNDCVCAIQAANEVDYTPQEKERLTNRLRSIIRQKQWKPSKEQLQALRWVCNRTFIAQEPQKESALEDLYEQLMAL